MAHKLHQTRKPQRLKTAHPLEPGEQTSQAEFHRRYLAMETADTFELLNGRVYRKPRNSVDHGSVVMGLVGLLSQYESSTPVAEGLANVSLILGPQNEAQVDLAFVVRPEFGGYTKITSGFVEGGPELVIEVADNASQADTTVRADVLRDAGTVEYVVACLRRRRLLGFQWPLDEIPTEHCRTLLWRSASFPGLVIDFDAVFTRAWERAAEALTKGMLHPERAMLLRRMERDPTLVRRCM